MANKQFNTECVVEREIDRWNRLWQQFGENIFYKPNIKVTDEIINLFGGKVAGKKILEVGAGSGSDCITLAKSGGECFALDFSKEALRVCQQLAKKENVEVKGIIADCRQIPIRDDFFDLVFSVGLVEHFKDPIPVLKEQLRVLKKGRFLIVDVPQKYNLYTIVKHLKIRHDSHPFGWETEYALADLKKIAGLLKVKPIRFYGRGSAFLGRLPNVFDFWWRKVFAKIEESKLAPFICLNIGAFYQK
ncbi:class I SAM-dependent methyltransferase [Patescibacteria group bacterium]|nr:class I SAM-dependent methyltransferase [Patescibacteria group bacterium]